MSPSATVSRESPPLDCDFVDFLIRSDSFQSSLSPDFNSRKSQFLSRSLRFGTLTDIDDSFDLEVDERGASSMSRVSSRIALKYFHCYFFKRSFTRLRTYLLVPDLLLSIQMASPMYTKISLIQN